MSIINSQEKILLAGSSGMVGSSIYKALKKNGYGDKSLGGEIYTPKRLDLNLLNTIEVINWFKTKNPSIVIIAAAKVGGIYANFKNPADFILENLKIQTNIIEAAFKSNVKRLIFLGSSCIYPKLSKQPIKEEYLLEGQLEATNEYYAIAKIAGIKLCEALNLQYGFDAISLMPTNLYGPGDNYNYSDSHVLPSLIRKFWEAKKSGSNSVTCWGTGFPMREFLHVDDLANACLFALKKWNPKSNHAPIDDQGNPILVLNVGCGSDISIKDLANMISDEIGFKGQIIWDSSKPDGMMKKLLDINKISNLGWEPKIQLKEGIKKTILEFKKNFANNKIRI